MSSAGLRREIEDGVGFWCFVEVGELAGVMGIQYLDEVTLIRHAYVRSSSQGKGIGSTLLEFLLARTSAPVLVGTWSTAQWAVGFYERHGFRLVSAGEHAALLNRYWRIPMRQVETSVVLADNRWFEEHGHRRRPGKLPDDSMTRRRGRL